MAETDLILAAKATNLEPVMVDGEIGPMTLNLDGRLRVASKPGYFAPVTGALTALGNTLVANVTDASNVMLHVKNTGSAAMAAGAFVFEGSVDSTDGSDGTWFALQAVRSDGNTIENGRAASSLAAGAGQGYAWELSVNAVRWFRVRCSTAVTASSIAMWTIIRGTYATEPIPGMQAHPVTGSGTFTVAGSATTTPVVGTPFKALGLAAVTGAIIKASAGQLMELSLFNPTAATIFFKLYDKASAPAVASDSALLLAVIEVPTLVSRNVEFGALGKRAGTGLGYALTAGAGNTDATAPATAGLVISGTYL